MTAISCPIKYNPSFIMSRYQFLKEHDLILAPTEVFINRKLGKIEYWKTQRCTFCQLKKQARKSRSSDLKIIKKKLSKIDDFIARLYSKIQGKIQKEFKRLNISFDTIKVVEKPKVEVNFWDLCLLTKALEIYPGASASVNANLKKKWGEINFTEDGDIVSETPLTEIAKIIHEELGRLNLTSERLKSLARTLCKSSSSSSHS